MTAAAAASSVVIGASAGGVETLTRVVRDLPADLPAAICIVLHIAPGSPSLLAKSWRGPDVSVTGSDGEPLREGVILVAPPDHHLVIEDSHVQLTTGPRENGHRPAIDVLFRSAAQALDSRVVGAVLSGTRADGTAGLAVIKASGGERSCRIRRKRCLPTCPRMRLPTWQSTQSCHLPASRVRSQLW